VIGDAPRRFLGTALVAADLDGDRRAEIVAASTSEPGPNGVAGALYVVRGTSGTLDLASSQAATTVYGPSPGAKLGSTLVAADLDGDGVRDIVTGAPGALGGRGSVYVIGVVRTVPDSPPVIATVGDVVAAVGESALVRFTANDPDGDPIRFAIVGRPPGSTFVDNGDGSAILAYTPAATGGPYLVTVRASDGQLLSATTFRFLVANGPVPHVTKVTYRSGVLKITGENFSAAATVTINGAAIERPIEFRPARRRLVVRGTAEELHIDVSQGANTVVVRVDGVPSEPFAF
jgi:hypothetical protein